MKRGIGILLALILGSLLGFFGVFVSVFADGNFSERVITIGVILLIYSVLNGVWGFLMPNFKWFWGFIYSLPAAVILIIYYTREPNAAYFLYILLIFGVSCASSFAGSLVRTSRR